ncbi:MAG TPA: hypothetical protein VGK19_09965 [Capsulimonadaceae bacterium]|jgi:hypothetical protein
MIDTQVIITDAIVAGAACYVAKRVWDQLAALRNSRKNGESPCDTCGGCNVPPPQGQTLIGIAPSTSTRPRLDASCLPPHLRRLSSDEIAPTSDPVSKN